MHSFVTGNEMLCYNVSQFDCQHFVIPGTAWMKPPATTKPIPTLSTGQTETLAGLFHLLGDRNRLRIVLACLDSPMPVGAIAESLGLSQSLVSHHLQLLRGARILRGERRGRQVFYAADDEHIRTVVTDLAMHVLEPGENPGDT